MPLTVELDLYVEEGDTTDEVARSMCEDSDISFRVVEEDGPTGWPLVRFSGEYAELQAMLDKHGFQDNVDTFLVE